MERHKLRVAVYAFFIKDNSIFLTRRFNTGWMDGKYGVPAGHLEKDETVVDALIREVSEEVGIALQSSNVKFVHVMNRMNIYMDLLFAISNWEGQPKNTEGDKCDDARWFPIEQLPENMVPSVRHAIEQYRKGVLLSEFNSEE